MRPVFHFALRITLGITFIILGIVGSFLPVLQGWLFFLIAALILFPEAAFTEKVLVKVGPKMPRLVAWLRRMGIGKKSGPPDDGAGAMP